MLKALTNVKDIKIMDIINYLAINGGNVYVFDIYRPLLERKMSEYFEKISSLHFNVNDNEISNYSLDLLIKRFNKIFIHFENGDHYFEKYNINPPAQFDFDKCYCLQIVNNIKFIKLRLIDSYKWDTILTNIFNEEIVIINDYETITKPIGNIYSKFKENYKLPQNYFEFIKNCNYFNYYYNNEEKNNYLNKLKLKLTDVFIPFTTNEYNFYLNLSLENQKNNYIDKNHYIDNRCSCKLCSEKRNELFNKAKNKLIFSEKIIHNEVVNQNIIQTTKTLVRKIKIPKQNKNNKYSKKLFKLLIK